MKNKHRYLILALLLILSEINAQHRPGICKLVASDRDTGSCLGWACAAFDNHVIGGSPFKAATDGKHKLKNVGSVYVFSKNVDGVWEQTDEVHPDGFQAGLLFGTALSLHADRMLIGANGDKDAADSLKDPRKGAAYIYALNPAGKSVFLQKIMPANRNSNDDFGSAVDISDRYAVVGAPGRKNGTAYHSPLPGAVYVYRLDSTHTYTEQQTLYPPDSNTFRFGQAVSLRDNRIAVSAAEPAEVYIYTFQQEPEKWTLTAVIKPDPAKEENFGESLCLTGQQLVVGAGGDGWQFEGVDMPLTDSVMEQLRPDDRGNFKRIFVLNTRHCKDSLGISETEFKAKANKVEPPESRQKRMAGAGSVSIYELDTDEHWNLQARIIPADLRTDEHFGRCVSANDSMLLVGAFGDKLREPNRKNNFYAGAAYLFRKNKDGVWKETEKITDHPRTPWVKYAFSVALSSDNVVIGSRFEPKDNTGKNSMPGAGAIYIYQQPATPESYSPMR